MSASAKERPTEHIEKIRQSRAKFYASPLGNQAKQKTTAGYKKWLENNPTAAKEMVQKQHQSRLERGVYKAVSENRRKFFQSPEGQLLKDKLRKERLGKARPLHVTNKMRQSLRAYWDSPEGIRLREEISAKRTHKLGDAPYGPGWVRQRAKIRQRDNYECIICHVSEKDIGKKFDVHHIYSRRLFGYIPGQNRNYLWANHPANLVTLCRSCHSTVENGAALVPEVYQTRANLLWTEFTRHVD